MTTKETITVVKTVEIHHGTKARFLPGDQRFILWYGLVTENLAPASEISGLVQSVKTRDGREWMLKKPVKKSDITLLLDGLLPPAWSNGDVLSAGNPWCPKGLERAWYDCALRRAHEHETEEV